MKEKDIRERIHIFLRDTVRYVVVPASMGIGLALVGCSDSSLNLSPDGSADSSSVQPGTGGSSGTFSSGVVAVYSAPMTGGTTGVSVTTGAGGATATGGMTAVPMYMAAMPDAGTGGVTGGAEQLGPAVPQRRAARFRQEGSTPHRCQMQAEGWAAWAE